MRTRLLVVISALALVLAGCEPEPTITEGTVTDKNYSAVVAKPVFKPAYHEVCFTNENQTRCEKVSKEVYDKAKVGEWFVLP